MSFGLLSAKISIVTIQLHADKGCPLKCEETEYLGVFQNQDSLKQDISENVFKIHGFQIGAFSCRFWS